MNPSSVFARTLVGRPSCLLGLSCQSDTSEPLLEGSSCRTMAPKPEPVIRSMLFVPNGSVKVVPPPSCVGGSTLHTGQAGFRLCSGPSVRRNNRRKPNENSRSDKVSGHKSFHRSEVLFTQEHLTFLSAFSEDAHSEMSFGWWDARPMFFLREC